MSDFVTVEARSLVEALKPAIAVIEKFTTIPVLKHVRLTYEKRGLFIEATDLDIWTRTVVDEIDGSGKWQACIPADLLMNIAKAAGSDIIRIESAGQIKVGDDASYDIDVGIKATDWPEPTTERADEIESFGNGSFVEHIAKVSWAISTEETRYYLNGVCWLVDKAGSRFVATDGHRLAACRYSPDTSDQPASRIIPRKTVAMVERFLRGRDVKVFATKKNTEIEIVASGLTIRSKLIDGTFPDIDRVIPKSHNSKIDFRRDELMSAIRKVQAVATERGRAVRFEEDAGTIRIEQKNADLGSARVATTVHWPKDAKPFAFNCRYLAEIVAKCANDLSLEMTDPGSPFSIKDADDTMTRVIMPMRA